MTDLAVSLSLLAGIVLLSEATRRAASRLFAGHGFVAYVMEFISTFQLCACTHELKLLGELGRVDLQIGLTLTYLISVIHALTFQGAIGNPSGALVHVYRRTLTGKSAITRIACQFIAAVVARTVVPYVWALGLSDLHLRHKLFGFKCITPIHAPLPKAAGVELACAFALQTAVTYMHGVEEKYRVHAIAAVITTLVYAGGDATGAVFNPALAFSTQFPCSGNSFAEYSFVYCLGPILGMSSSFLLFDKVIPLLSGKRESRNNVTFNDLSGKKRN